jgi:hypothetical protein
MTYLALVKEHVEKKMLVRIVKNEKYKSIN